MRYLTNYTAALALAFLLACAYEKTAFRTVGSLTTVVDAAMKAYGDEVKLNHITAENQTKVKTFYDSYYASIQLAQSVVLSYKEGSATRSSVQQALDAASASAQPLINLIKTLIPATKAAALKL